MPWLLSTKMHYLFNCSANKIFTIPGLRRAKTASFFITIFCHLNSVFLKIDSVFRPVSACRPSTTWGRLPYHPYHTILPLNLSVIETVLTIKIVLWNWHTVYPMCHDELPLRRRKENNFFNRGGWLNLHVVMHMIGVKTIRLTAFCSNIPDCWITQVDRLPCRLPPAPVQMVQRRRGAGRLHDWAFLQDPEHEERGCRLVPVHGQERRRCHSQQEDPHHSRL